MEIKVEGMGYNEAHQEFMNNRKAWLELHDVKEGDKVYISRVFDFEEEECRISCTTEMKKMIGQTGTVVKVSAYGAISIKCLVYGVWQTYNWPHFVLTKTYTIGPNGTHIPYSLQKQRTRRGSKKAIMTPHEKLLLNSRYGLHPINTSGKPIPDWEFETVPKRKKRRTI